MALTAFLGIVPLAFLLWQSFLTPETATEPAQLTFENYRTAYWSVETLRLFDSANAAQRIKVPMLVAVALFDPAVAPPCQFAVPPMSHTPLPVVSSQCPMA